MCYGGLAKRSMPISEPWLLRMARIATNSIHHCGNRLPHRIRQSMSSWRKLIRSLATEGIVNGEANAEEHAVHTTAQMAWSSQGYWDRLLMGLGVEVPKELHLPRGRG